jgi:hypothetical protein
MESEGLLPRSQEPAVGPYPELDESSQNTPTTSCQVLLLKSSSIWSP